MPATVVCPQCGTPLDAPPDVYGRTVRCPSCSLTFTARPGRLLATARTVAPRNPRRTMYTFLIFAGAIAVPALIAGVLWLTDDPASRFQVEPTERNSARKTIDEQMREEARAAIKPLPPSGDGLPPADGQADRMPPPGQALKLPTDAAKKPVLLAGFEATISNLRWEAAVGQRTLSFDYAFADGQVRPPRAYVMRIKLPGGTVAKIDLNAMPASGTMPLTLTAGQATDAGLVGKDLSRVEVWLERAAVGAAASGPTVSNVVTIE